MRNRSSLCIAIAALALAGCATFKDDMVHPTGDRMTCQSTGGGLIGMAVAANASSSCADTYRGRGYKPVAEAVATGIVLSKDEMPAKILTVKQDSPAAKAALKSGDVIVAVDGNPVTNRIDAGKALHDGAVGSTTKVTVRRGNQELTVTLTRIAFASLADKS